MLRQSVADPDKFSMVDNFRTSMMINELAMKDASDYQGQVCGVVILQVSLVFIDMHVHCFKQSDLETQILYENFRILLEQLLDI